MGQFTEVITLKNTGDVNAFRRGLIKEGDIRQVTIRVIPDTGASTLFITEKICQKLGLFITGESVASIADGSRKSCKKTEGVDVHWKDRSTICQALVMSGSRVNLLGAIPLEGMDLRVNPVKRRLEGVHGRKAIEMAL